MLGGIFTSVVVPMLVRAAKEDPDRGEGVREADLHSLGVIALLDHHRGWPPLLAGPLVNLYGGNITDAGRAPRSWWCFAYFFIPQIFFYGMDSLLGAILNVRGRFGANMWTPVINNVVVIFVGVLFMVTVGNARHRGQPISGLGIDLLGDRHHARHRHPVDLRCSPCMRRAGFSMRLTLRLPARRDRRDRPDVGLDVRLRGQPVARQPGRAAGGELRRDARTCTTASLASATPPTPTPGSSSSCPYAIVGISVISALLPRMSGHATDRRYSLVRDDFSKGVRLASVIVVPAAVFLAVLGAPLCEFLFAHGHTTVASARYIGEVFGAFSPRPGAVHADPAAAAGVLLVPREQDPGDHRHGHAHRRRDRRPGRAVRCCRPTHTVIGLAFAYDLVTLTGAVIAWPLLLRRVGSLDGWRITRSLVRMFLATLPGLLFAFVMMAVVGSFMHQGPLYGLVTTVIGGGGALLLYALCCRMLGIEEFRTLHALRRAAGSGRRA